MSHLTEHLFRKRPCADCGTLTEFRDGVCRTCIRERNATRAKANAGGWSPDMVALTDYDPKSDCTHPRLLGRWCMACGREVA